MRLHKADNKKVDPVECLLTYLNKTARLTDSDGPASSRLNNLSVKWTRPCNAQWR